LKIGTEKTEGGKDEGNSSWGRRNPGDANLEKRGEQLLKQDQNLMNL
jgi:hypothetical protein